MLRMLVMRARCLRVARALQSYLDGEIGPVTAAMVAEHLEECRRCGLEASTYLALKAAIAAAGDDRPGRVDPAAMGRLDDFALSLRDGDGEPPGGSSPW